MSIPARLRKLETLSVPKTDIAAILHASRKQRQGGFSVGCSDDDLVRDGSPEALSLWRARRRACCQVQPSTLTPPEQ